MDVIVKLFASLAETEGWRQKPCRLSDGATVREAWAVATGRHDMPARVLCAVNLDYRELSTPLQSGDEIAFFPPVTGG